MIGGKSIYGKLIVKLKIHMYKKKMPKTNPVFVT